MDNRLKSYLFLAVALLPIFPLQAHSNADDYCKDLLSAAKQEKLTTSRCVITRASAKEKKIALLFTGGSFAESYPKIRAALTSVNGKASFFLTGEFLREESFRPIIQDMLSHKDYVGPHSDSHYIPVDRFKGTIISRDFFRSDLQKNFNELAKFGVKKSTSKYWILPEEDDNEELAKWSYSEGLKIINFTKGTRTNADYTAENESIFVSNEVIYQSVRDRHNLNTSGLNGFFLLFHVGVGDDRLTPFADRLPTLLQELKAKGYTFVRIDELLDPAIGSNQ